MAHLRHVRLRDDRTGEPGSAGSATRVIAPSPRAPSARAAWIRGYDTVRAVCSAPNAPGVGVFGIDPRGVASAAVMAARPDGIQTAIVGRHPETHLPLTGDEAVSTRHLAVVLHPLGEERLSFRLIDLRTTGGTCDERGRRFEHLVSDGPAFVQLGRYCLLVVPLCDPRLAWPDDPIEAWRRLPARVFRTIEGAHRPRGPRAEPSEPPADPKATLVQTIPGPRCARDVLRPVEVHAAGTLLGDLVIASRRGPTASIPLDPATARSGLLLGRDDRCDDGGALLDDPRISRVHLLVLEVEGVLYAVDTASTNGVWRGETDAGAVALRPDQRLTIARDLAWVKWIPAPSPVA